MLVKSQIVGWPPPCFCYWALMEIIYHSMLNHKDRWDVYQRRQPIHPNCTSSQDNCCWFLKISCFQDNPRLWTELYPKVHCQHKTRGSSHWAVIVVLDYTAFSSSDKNESKRTGYLLQQKSELSDSQVLGGNYLPCKNLKITHLCSLCPESRLSLQNIIINIFQQICRQGEEYGNAR